MTKYAIVPVEPTNELLLALAGVTHFANAAEAFDWCESYSAMLAASPPSDLVAVPRGLLERVSKYPVDYRNRTTPETNQEERDRAEIRALLSTTPTGEG